MKVNSSKISYHFVHISSDAVQITSLYRAVWVSSICAVQFSKSLAISGSRIHLLSFIYHEVHSDIHFSYVVKRNQFSVDCVSSQFYSVIQTVVIAVVAATAAVVGSGTTAVDAVALMLRVVK